MKKLLAIVAGMALCAMASAQTYKWTDADGRVRYGDTPPPGVKATRLKGPAAAPTPPPAEGKKDAASKDAKKDAAASKDKPLSPEAAFRKRQQDRQEEEQKAAKARAEADQKRAGCEQAQASLRQLESGQRISSVNAAGERVFIEDDQRAKEIARAQKSVAEWCK